LPGAGKLSAAELQAIAQRSNEVLRGMGPKIQWVQSYVADDKIYCVYLAEDEADIRAHAKDGGFPANRIFYTAVPPRQPAIAASACLHGPLAPPDRRAPWRPHGTLPNRRGRCARAPKRRRCRCWVQPRGLKQTHTEPRQSMIKFYFSGAPNPTKVALFLEEAGLAYEPIPVDTRQGQQFTPAFLAVNPNSKVPAIVDGDAIVFDSNAILLYLAEKTGKFLPANTPAARGELLSWLMFVGTGVGPFSGQAVHFGHHAPEKIAYANTRYRFEAERHYGIANERLANRRYMVGDTYTIVDMDLWGWARMVPYILGDDAAMARFPNVKRLIDEINARPAAQHAVALKDKFTFKAEMDDEARSFMFRHLRKAG
jgi:GST-like protein